MNNTYDIQLNFKVYCFDIFDTIVSRSVEPEYVKKLWSKEIKAIYKTKETTYEIYTIRNQLEKYLCENNQIKGCDLEFQYTELIEMLYPKISFQIEQDVTLEQFYTMAYNIELQIEKSVEKICEDTFKHIKNIKNKGYKIICISDFYMPKDFLLKLLQYHKIDTYIDDVFVSSDYLITKRSGKLYDYVIDELNVSKSNLIMIGDNSWSDYEIPKQKGIAAVLIDRKQNRNYYQQFIDNKNTSKSIENKLWDIYLKCNRNKYEDIAFAIYHYIETLYYMLRQYNTKNVFFLSREGEFLKKVFDYYQGRRIVDDSDKINSHYLMVSRKSTFIASLKSLDEEKFEMIFRQYVNISLYDFLSSLGFSIKEELKIGELINIDIYEKMENFPRTEVYTRLLKCSYFKKLYEEKRLLQKNNFNAYMNSYNVDISKEGIFLVDVGWKGTIQDNIFTYYNESVTINGLYLGLVANGLEHPLNKKYGLLFQNKPFNTKYYNIYNENRSIFEIILGASHGSADHYEKKDNIIKVITSEQEEEKKLFDTLIGPLQIGIFKVIESINECLNEEYYDNSELDNIWADIHARFVFLPTKKQVEFFYDIYHYENFGVFEFTKFKKQKYLSPLIRVKNFARMLKLRSGFFRSSFWGIIALKDAGLSLLIKPYGIYMYKRFLKEERERTNT